MLRHIALRTLGGVVTVVLGAMAVFFLIRLIPGNPIALLLERAGSPEAEATLRRTYGLDQPVTEQFTTWVSGLAHGDVGVSIASRQPVLPELLVRIPRTLWLMAGGLAVSLTIALAAGIVAARNRARWPDTVVVTGTTLLLAVPQFWFGLLLIALFAVTLGWLPAGGYVSPGEDLGASIESMILPWLTIGLTTSAFMTRVLRSSLLDVLGLDYIRTVRSRGLSEGAMLRRHALKNASLPAVTVIGLEVGYLLGGAIVVEKVFSYPGIGQLIVNSIVARDYPVVQVGILFFLVAFVVVNILTDLAYGLLDPRVRSASR